MCDDVSLSLLLSHPRPGRKRGEGTDDDDDEEQRRYLCRNLLLLITARGVGGESGKGGTGLETRWMHAR